MSTRLSAPVTSGSLSPARVGSRLMLLLGLLCPLPLLAQVAGETVVAGSASFNRSGATTTITAANNTIINYATFNIGTGQTVQFIQPTDTSRVLNRVTTQDPTQILGTLRANGLVYIVNPAGVFFGKDSFLDVGGLYAAAGTIANADFLAGANRFSGLSGTVSNAGTIQSRGDVALLGANVANFGTIASTGGRVSLFAGDGIYLGEAGEHVFVNLGTPKTGTGVTNSGTLSAGTVELAAGDVYSLAIQQSGVVKGTAIKLGGGKGAVQVGGTLDASNAKGTGGQIQVLGHAISLDGTAKLDASGSTGGGKILVGGDFQGKNPSIQNAMTVTVRPGATITADARQSGNGGQVVVWSDGTTLFGGNISARGGASGGNGGAVEVSGKQRLLYQGLVDTRAPFGKMGTLLLDPDNIQIIHATDATSDTFDTVAGAGPYNDSNSTATDSAISDFTINAQLATAAVTIQTSQGGSITDQSNVAVNLVGNSLTLNSAAGITLMGSYTGIGTLNLDFATTLDLTAAQPFTGLTVAAVGADSGATANSTIKAANETWTVTGANQGNLGTLAVAFTDVGNLTDTGTGTLQEANATWMITGANAGQVTNLTGVFGGMGNLTDTGTGTLIATSATWNLTGANQGTVSNLSGGFAGMGNLTDLGTGVFDMYSSANGSITGDLNGGTNGTLDYTGYTTPVTLNLAGTGTTGIAGTVSGIKNVTASAATDTVTGASQTYNLTGANAGNNGTYFWTGFGNLTDTGTGAFAMHSTADGSLTGNLNGGTNGTLNYTGYTTAVTLNLAGTGTTGVAGTVSGIKNVTAAAATDTVTGASQTYNLTGSNAGNNGTYFWTGFGNLTDTGTGIFAMHSTANGSVTGNLNGGTNGTLNYTGYTTATTLNLGGTGTTGVGGTISGIKNVTASAIGGTVTGASQTYNLTGSNAGNNGTYFWTGFGNLTDTGTGIFAMHSTADGSLTGNLNGGTNGTLSYTGYTSAVTLNLAGSGTTGIGGTVSGIKNVTASAATDTVTGANQTYTITGSNAGNNGTYFWTGFGNFTDTGTGTLRATSATWNLTGANQGTVSNLTGSFGGMGNLTDLGTGVFNLHSTADGSLTGNLNGGTNGTLNYTGYTTATALNLGGTGTTGVGGTVSGIKNVTASAVGGTVTGASQTYNLTGANAGNNGTYFWTGFGNLTDTGTGIFAMHSTADGSLTGNLNGGTNGTLNYTNYTTATTLNLAGTGTTGVGGTVSGIKNVTASAIGGTVTGASQTYNLTGANAGNNGTYFWTGFGNLTDTGTGIFVMHSTANGSLTGNLNGGTNGTLNYTGYTTAVTLNLAGTGTTGVAGTVSGIKNVTAAAATDTVTGASQSYNLTGANAGNNGTYFWSGFGNLTDTGTGSFVMHSTANGSLTGNLNGGTNGTLNYTGYTTAVTLNLSGTGTTGVGGTVSGIKNVTASTATDTVTGASQTYNLTGANAGNNGTYFWTGFGNLTDTGTGIFAMYSTANGSLTGNLNGGTNGTLNYTNYTTATTLNLAGTGTTGVGGTVSGIKNVTASAIGGTVTGASQTYNLTGADAGNNGTYFWTSFGNLTDTGTGTFVMHSTADGSLTGNLNGGTNGTLNYTSYTTPVTLDLSGTGTTGVAGTVSGIKNVTAAAATDTVTGASQTYNLTGANAGNNGTYFWSGFGNLTDTGTGTFVLHSTADGSLTGNLNGGTNGSLDYTGYTTAVTLNLAGTGTTGVGGTVFGIKNVTAAAATDTVTGASQTYNLTGADAGNNGTYFWTGFGNLTDTGTGAFVMHSTADGSLTGSLNGGTNGSLDYTGYTAAVTLNLTGTGTTGVGGTVSGIKNVTAAAATDTVAGASQTYNLTGADAGNNGTYFWTGFGNLTDTGTGVFVMHSTADGSLTGNLNGGTNGTLNYTSYTTPVTLDLSGTGTTGVAGTVSGIKNVTAAAATDTVTGASQTYNLTGADAGNNGTYFWTGFGNLTDTGTGIFAMHSTADGSLTGNLNGGTNGTLNYSGYTTAMTLNLSGTGTTGVAGTVSGIKNVTAANATDTVTGASQTYNLTGANAGNNGTYFWTGFGNLTDTGTGIFAMHSTADGSLTGNLNGGTNGTLNYTGYTTAATLNLAGAGTTGVAGTVSGIKNVTAGATGGTVTGASQTYNLTGANAGNNGTYFWTGFGNLTDTGTGAFVMHSTANGSLSGNLNGGTNGSLNYAGYTTAVTLNLAGTGTTGVAGTVSGIKNVTANAATDTVTGASQTYNLTGANAGNNGTYFWTGFGNLTDTGTGVFNLHSGANGSLTGNLNGGTNGTLNYTGYTTPVTLNLAGTGTTGVAGTVSGIKNVTAAAATDTVTGLNQTYTITGSNGGNNGTYFWTGFGNLTDTGAGTLKEANATWTVTGADAGTVTNLTGAFGGMGNLTDTGTGTLKATNATWTIQGANTGKVTNLTGTFAGMGNFNDLGAGTLKATSATWNLTGLNQGTVTNLSGSFTGMNNLTDQGTGVFNMHSGANGSIAGNLNGGTNGTLNYSGYTTAVTVNLAGTGTTGVAGTVSGITNVTAAAATDVMTGYNQTYTITGSNAGNNGTYFWTGFGNLTDTGVGTLKEANATWTITGANAGTVTNLTGVFAGMGNLTDTGIGTLDATNATWTILGSNTGHVTNLTGAYTGMGNLNDLGTGTLKATSATWSLTGANRGTVSNLSGSFTGMGNLTDLGTGVFNMHSTANGSITGNLNGGSNGTLDYTGYTAPVTLNLASTGTTGIGGTVSGIKNVTASAATDTVTGASQTYTLTASNAGNNGTYFWTGFGNLTDTGTGVFHVTAGGITGNLNGGTNGTMTVNGGATFGGTVGNIATLTLNAASDFQGNLTVSNSMVANAGAYDVRLGGLNNSIAGTTLFSNTGTLTLTGGTTTFASGATHQAGATVVDGTAIATAGNLTFDATTLNGELEATAGGITTGALTLTGQTDSLLGGTIQTSNITIADGDWLVLDGSSITTGSIAGTAGGARSSLTLAATGAVAVNGTVGTDFGTLMIAQSNGAAFSGTVAADTVAIADTQAGKTVDFQGNLTVGTSLSGAAGTAGYNVRLGGASNSIAGTTTFANTGLLTLTGGTTTFASGVNHTTGATWVNGTATATAGNLAFGATTLNGALNATAGGVTTGALSATATSADAITGGTIQTGAIQIADGDTLTLKGSSISTAAISGTAGGTASNVAFDATGAVTVSGAVGTDLGNLTVTNSNGATFQSTVNAGSIAIANTAAGQTVEFQGNVTATTSLGAAAGTGAYNVQLDGAANSVAGQAAFANTGTVTLTGGTTTFANGATHTAGSTVVNGTATATAGNLVFAATTLAGDLNATAGGITTTTLNATGTADAVTGGTIQTGNITIGDGDTLTLKGSTISTGAISGVLAGSASNVTFDATGAVTVTGAVGVDLGVLNVAHSASTTFQNTVSAATIGLANTPGAISFQRDTAATTGLTVAASVHDVSFTGSTTSIGGATSFLNTGTLTLGDGGDTLTFAGGFTATVPAVVLNGDIEAGNAAINLGTTTLAGTTTIGTAGGNLTFATTLDSATTTAQNLTVNAGSGAIKLTGAAGGTHALGAVVLNSTGATTVTSTLTAASVATDSGGTMTVNGGAVTTTGAQTYSDALTLGNSAGTTLKGANLTLGSTVAGGGFNLTLNDTGTTTLNGNITGVNVLSVTGGGTTAINGIGITTTGNQTYDNAIQLGSGATTLSASGQSITLNRDVTTASSVAANGNSLAISGATLWLHNVTTNGNQTYTDTSLLKLNSTYTTNGGALSISGHTSAPSTVTIWKQSTGDLVFTTGAGAVNIGPNERIIVTDGSLIINSSGAVTIPDTIASRSISIAAGSLTFNGDRFLAGTISYTHSGTLTFTPRSGNSTVELGTWDGTVGGDLIGAVSRTRIDTAKLTGATISPSVLGQTATNSDTTGIAFPTKTDILTASTEDISTFLSSGVPTQNVEVTQETSVDEALREQMVRLGIYARPLSQAETRQKLLGAVVYQQIIEDEAAEADKYEVADNRLSANGIRAALKTYEELFFVRSADGKTDSRLSEIQQALVESYRRYTESTSSPDAAGFRAYLESHGAKGEADAVALSTVQQLGKLFQQIERLGLTSKEVDISKSVLLRPLRVPGLSSRALRQVIEQNNGAGGRVTRAGADLASSDRY